jgi:outer membrane murein-binding lipoprotein Lpp
MSVKFRRLSRILLVVFGVAVLAGCASSGSPGQATQWVVEDAQQKAKLEAEGFPQYLAGS